MTNSKKVGWLVLGMILFELAAVYSGILNISDGMIYQLLVSQLVFGLPAIVYLIVLRKPFTSTVRVKKISFSTILLCILFYICMYPVFTFINTLSMLYSTNEISTVIYSLSTEAPYLVGLFLVAIVPAFLEELTYRGVIYNELREVSPIGAVLLSGLIFGLFHGNLNQFTYAFLLGCVFALLVEATDSILSTMVVHALVNSVSTTLIYLLPKAFDTLAEFVELAKEENDSLTLSLIEQYFGTDELNFDTYLAQAEETLSHEVVLSTLMSSLPWAVGFGFLAFLIFRKIARRCGRWDAVRSIFTKKQLEPVDMTRVPVVRIEETEEGIVETFPGIEEEPAAPKPKLFTWPLIVALVLLVAVLVINTIGMSMM